jgi:hypothetical protein
MMKIVIPVETGNRAAKAGKLGQTIQSILAEQKPEAVYFGDETGKRTGFVFVKIDDSSEIPRLAEPWFLAFDATVEFHPVMTPEDLAKAAPDIEWAVKKFA